MIAPGGSASTSQAPIASKLLLMPSQAAFRALRKRDRHAKADPALAAARPTR